MILNSFVAAELSLLIPEFRKPLNELLTACKARGVHMEVLTTIITPLQQAVLWHQGRTATDAQLKVLALEHAGALYLADCIRRTQPLESNLVTNDLPGFSWYQWGEKVKCVWVDGCRIVRFSVPTPAQSEFVPLSGYRVFAEEAQRIGLIHGSMFDNQQAENWTTVQLKRSESPGDVFSIIQIDAEMKKRFSR